MHSPGFFASMQVEHGRLASHFCLGAERGGGEGRRRQSQSTMFDCGLKLFPNVLTFFRFLNDITDQPSSRAHPKKRKKTDRQGKQASPIRNRFPAVRFFFCPYTHSSRPNSVQRPHRGTPGTHFCTLAEAVNDETPCRRDHVPLSAP